MDALLQFALALGASVAVGRLVAGVVTTAQGSIIAWSDAPPAPAPQEIGEPPLLTSSPRVPGRPPAWATQVGGAAAARRPALRLVEPEVPDEIVVERRPLHADVHRRRD